MEDRMIEAIERGWATEDDAYDFVRESLASAADGARKRAREMPGPFACNPDESAGAASEEDETYEIVLFRQNSPQEILKRGVTLEEAQAYCSDPKTSGRSWFAGYRAE